MNKNILDKYMDFRKNPIIILTTLLIFGLYYGGYISTQGLTSSFAFKNNGTAILTSISSLYAGKFQSSIDKQGTAGTYLTIRDVKVVAEPNFTELDGDRHFTVEDRFGKLLTVELTPLSQTFYNTTEPTNGTTINIYFIYYCDQFHQNQLWHSSGNCAEAHPLIGWTSNLSTFTPRNVSVIQEQINNITQFSSG